MSAEPAVGLVREWESSRGCKYHDIPSIDTFLPSIVSSTSAGRRGVALNSLRAAALYAAFFDSRAADLERCVRNMSDGYRESQRKRGCGECN